MSGKSEEALENQLFSWKGWDLIDTVTLNFTGVTLNVDIGDHKKGKHLAAATIDFDEGLLQLFRSGVKDEEPEEYRLILSVGERI